MSYELNDRREEHEMNARIFVVMNDKFLSGWGNASHGRSIFVVACPNISIAEKVTWFAENKRSEMTHISVRRRSLKSALSSRRLRSNDHVSVVGANNHWADIGNHFDLEPLWKEVVA